MIFLNLKNTLTLCAAVLVTSLPSCSHLPFKKAPATTAPVIAPVAQWYQIEASPPTYLPKGLPKNTPTSAFNGFWVNGGNGSLWFVPKNGIKGFSAAQLQQAALKKQEAFQQLESKNAKAQKKVVRSQKLNASKKKVMSALQTGYEKVKNPF